MDYKKMVVEVMKVRMVSEENNDDKDLEEETKEMVVVEGIARMEVVMMGPRKVNWR